MSVKLTLAEHIKRSREAVAANKAKGNKHAELFATMYTQPSRFIEEILQNTEDAYSRKNTDETYKAVRFKLFSDKIEVHHNGKDFDENDLMSITTFANTTKKSNSEINLIGKFGIGFKSVFSITDLPEIHCGRFHYKITDFEVLTACEPVNAEPGFNTLIVLPFKRKSVDDCYNSVLQGLKELSAYHLLFLKKLNLIEIFENNKPFCVIEKENLRLKKNIELRRIKKKTFLPLTESVETFLVYSILGKNKKLAPELAYKVEESEGTFTFIPIEDAPLFVYFPLKMYSGQNFLIHAPFTTNPLRDFALFDKDNCPENIQMLDDSVQTFISSLTDFKKMGFYSVDLLSKVFNTPRKDNSDKQKSIIQQKYYNALKEFFVSGENIPVGRNKFAKIDNTAIPEDENIYKLLEEQDLRKLFQRLYFIDPVICSEEKTDFRNFLKNDLNIKTIDAESFAFRLKVNAGFFEGKSIKWLKEFYRYLHTQQKLWDIQHAGQYYSLRHSPIILTSKNTFEAAYNNDHKPKVFLPGGKKDLLPVVHHRLFSDEFCAAFFSDLELKVPDTFSDVIYNILPQFEQGALISQVDYYKKLDKIIQAYSESSINEREVLVDLLKKTPWVQSYDKSGRKQLSVPSQSYIRNDLLVQYFKFSPDICFMDTLIYSRLFRKYPLIAKSFIQETGIASLPRISYSNTNEPIIDGFDEFLQKIDIEMSKAVARIMINAKEDYFNEEILQFLRKQPWVYTKIGNYAAPEKISLSQLSAAYRFNEADKLRFQMMMGIKSALHSDVDHNAWQPVLKPEQIDISKLIDFNKPHWQLDNNINKLNKIHPPLNLFEPSDITLKDYSTADLKNIYKWSYDFVIRFLSNEFPAPEYSIQQTDKCGILIVKNEQTFRRVLVCGKTDLMSNFYFPANQFVKIFSLSHSKENTILCCVESVGNVNVSFRCFKNPFDMVMQEKIQFSGNLFLSPE